MVKPKIGLPDSFSINVSPVVDLGDYLDETTTAPPSNLAPAAKADERGNQQTKMIPQVLPANQIEQERPEQATGPSAPRRRKPRRQINMNPSTQKKFNEIIAYVQAYSPQSDAAASEIMEAIISAHYEALTHLNFGAVRPRGRWGDPTAEAFKHALSRSFVQAIVELANSSG